MQTIKKEEAGNTGNTLTLNGLAKASKL